jgi:membrane-bound lytic murein transglycosylase
MQKIVENQGFVRCWQSVENQGVYALRNACGKDAERMRKNCGMKQIVENQALEQFLSAFPHMRKDISHQARPPTWHDFCRQKTRFFNTFSYKRNKQNENRKIFENQGFELFRKSFRKHSASFPQTCQLAKNLL